jgi:hypothetical protein
MISILIAARFKQPSRSSGNVRVAAVERRLNLR